MYNFDLIFNPVFGFVLLSGMIGVLMMIYLMEKINAKT